MRGYGLSPFLPSDASLRDAGVSNRKSASFLNANCRYSAGSAGVSPALEAVQGLHLGRALRSHRCGFLTHHSSPVRSERCGFPNRDTRRRSSPVGRGHGCFSQEARWGARQLRAGLRPLREIRSVFRCETRCPSFGERSHTHAFSVHPCLSERGLQLGSSLGSTLLPRPDRVEVVGTPFGTAGRRHFGSLGLDTGCPCAPRSVAGPPYPRVSTGSP